MVLAQAVVAAEDDVAGVFAGTVGFLRRTLDHHGDFVVILGGLAAHVVNVGVSAEQIVLGKDVEALAAIVAAFFDDGVVVFRRAGVADRPAVEADDASTRFITFEIVFVDRGGFSLSHQRANEDGES